MSIIKFHGGCSGCTQQEERKEGADFCVNCRYFDANWSLPNHNNEPPSLADQYREKIKAKHMSRLIIGSL